MASGVGSILDLSDPLRDVYLELLRSDPMTLEEMHEHPVLSRVEALKVHVMILVRQGMVERFKQDDAVRFRPAAVRRPRRGVPDDIWESLE